MNLGGLDSSTILIIRGGIPRPIGNFPESLSQAILVGIMLGRLAVPFTLQVLRLDQVCCSERNEPSERAHGFLPQGVATLKYSQSDQSKTHVLDNPCRRVMCVQSSALGTVGRCSMRTRTVAYSPHYSVTLSQEAIALSPIIRYAKLMSALFATQLFCDIVARSDGTESDHPICTIDDRLVCFLGFDVLSLPYMFKHNP